MLLEIRCCCIPRKLLGYVDVPSGIAQGQQVTFVLKTKWGEPLERLSLTADTYTGEGERKLALRSGDQPMEVLRRIPGFKEVSPTGRILEPYLAQAFRKTERHALNFKYGAKEFTDTYTRIARLEREFNELTEHEIECWRMYGIVVDTVHDEVIITASGTGAVK